MCDQAANESAEIFCLNPEFSTTRLVTDREPVIENYSEDQFETKLFLPEGDGRQGEGGLRSQGYFKKSLSDKPLISVITVVFDGEQFLEETIQSVINQSYDNIEYIIIDGRSTDGTLDIIRNYEHVIDYWISEKDKGIYDAMNKGIYASSGEYLYFLNSGDFLISKYTLGHIITRRNDYDFIYGYVKLSNKIEKNNIKRKFDLLFSTICHQGIIASKKCFLNNQFSTSLKWLSDYLWVIKCFSSKNIKKNKINEIICYFDSDNHTSLNNLQLRKERLNERLKIGLAEFNGIYKCIFIVNQLRLYIKFLLSKK